MEYAAMVVVVALVVGSVYVAIAGQDNRVYQAICRAVDSVLQTDAGCTPATPVPQTDEDFEPDKCKINERGEEVSAVVRIGFIEFGQNAGFIVTEYSDGSVSMTATDGATLGATGGVGADASLGTVEAGAEVDFGGGVKLGLGSTWNFASAEEAAAMQEQLSTYIYQQRLMRSPDAPVLVFGLEDPPREADEVLTSIGGYGDVSGSLGIDFTSGTDSNGSSSSIPAAELAGSIGLDSTWSTLTNNTDNTVTYSTEVTLNGSVSGSLWTESIGTEGAVGATLSITKDSDGNITNVTFVTTNEGSLNAEATASGGESNNGGTPSDDSDDTGGDVSFGMGREESTATVTTTSLDVDPNSSSEQQIVQNWLSEGGGLISAGMLNPETASPNNPFENLLHEQANVSAVTYDNITDAGNFGLNVKLGVALGFDFSLESSESNAVGATYLGAPDANGIRNPTPFPECVT